MNSLIVGLVATYFIDIIGFVVVGIVSLIAYKKGNGEAVRRVVLSLVIQAEKQLGNGTGELKYQMVLDNLYSRMPAVLRWMYSKEQMDNMIEDAVEYLKRYLADGKDLKGIE